MKGVHSLQTEAQVGVMHDKPLLTWVSTPDLSAWLREEGHADKAAARKVLEVFHSAFVGALLGGDSGGLARLLRACEFVKATNAKETVDGISGFNAWLGCDCEACEERRIKEGDE